MPSAQAPAIRCRDSAADARRQRGELRVGLQVRLAVGPAQVAQRLQRPAVEDAGQDVVQLTVLGSGVVDIVRDDDRQPELVRQGDVLRNQPVVVGQQVVRQLDEERGAWRRPSATP